jgi:phospho-N-acetylmuramoyl-pentapeptide-transferase
MLFHLAHYLYPMHDKAPALSVLRVVSYITVRTAAASLTALGISLLLGPWFIRRLRAFQIGQVIRTDGPASHKAKSGTPTMGGVLILTAVLVPVLLWANLTNPYIWIAVLATAGFGAVGFLDDYLKVKRQNHHGLSEAYKLAGQSVVAVGVGISVLLLAHHVPQLYNTRLIFPFFKNWIPDLGYFYILVVWLVLVGTSNGVNFTDGLDGLAISTFAVAAATFTAFTYVTGHLVFSTYLNLVHFPPVGELTIFCGALVGASLGFLWWNAHPADVFMGDVGSLALGGALGTVAVLIKQELLLPIVGGVFVMEGLSVIIQRASYKLRGGRRVFKMAPIHHHFELVGWAEPKIITRFLILAIIFALFSLMTLKLR